MCGWPDTLQVSRFGTLYAAVMCLALAILLLRPLPAYAQEPITAEVDRTILTAREQLMLTVKVQGDFLDIPNPDLSELTDFVVVNSRISTQVSIINGDLTTQGVFVYTLQPLREGGLEIGPISVNLDGQVYQTAPIDIRVVAVGTPAPTPDAPAVAPDTLQGQKFYVEAEVDNSTPYLGQQITYVFRLFQAGSFLGQPDYQPPSFTNFWSQTVLSQPTYSASIDGRDYLVTEVRTALFPAKIGPVTISPAKIVIPNFPYQDIVLESEPVTIQVQSLPEGAPKEFKGAVGQFSISASLSDSVGMVNEPLNLILEISGAGNIEALVEPTLPELPNWRIFESQSKSIIEVQDNKVYGTRRFERLIVPRQPGQQTIPPISLVYFDPDTGQYQTISTEPIVITIQPSQGESVPPLADDGPVKQTITVRGGDIRHIKPVPPTLMGQDSPWLGQTVYWTLWVLPVIGVAGVWLWQNRRQHLQENTAYARSLRAKRVALETLAEARQANVDAYAVAQRALLGYLSDKLNRPTIGLTHQNLVNLLQKARLDSALIKRVEDTLVEIDVGRYAPVGEAAVENLMATTRQLIDDLEKGFKHRGGHM
jgi:hypothetical protein